MVLAALLGRLGRCSPALHGGGEGQDPWRLDRGTDTTLLPLAVPQGLELLQIEAAGGLASSVTVRGRALAAR